MTNKIQLGGILILLGFYPSSDAATLKPETKAAWDAYLQEANAAMQARLQPGAHFLWLDDEPSRAEDIRTKGPYIAPIGPHIPKKVPSGLIHDWLGVGFVPNAKIEDILRILRDYDRYKEIYQPGVLDSLSHSTDGVKDLFSMRLANRSVVAKTALDTECEASYFRVDERRWYSVSNTVHIQELDKFGTTGAANLARGPWHRPYMAAIQHHTPGGARWRGVCGARSHRIKPRYSCGVPPIRDAHRATRIERFARHITSPNESSHR